MVASTFAALCILLADRIWRPDWDFSWSDHWRGAPILYSAAAGLMGLAWVILRLAQQGVSQSFVETPRKRDWIRASFVAALAGACVSPFAARVFSGERVSDTSLGLIGPILFTLFAVVVALIGTILMWRLQRRVARHHYPAASGVAFGLLALAALVLWIDMTLYVGLYSHIHDFLEFCAFCLFFSSFQLLGFVLVQKWTGHLVIARVIAGGVVLLLVSFATIRPVRTWTDARLAHAWVDEYYVGRAIRRLQQMELSLSRGGSLKMARVDHLARRFHVQDRSLAPEWMTLTAPTALYPGVKNVVFFYVDTLRADVAHDATLMPNFARFKEDSLVFPRAYASGSDTLRSLPTITSGNYFVEKTHPGDLLRLAKQSGKHRVLIVAQSASEFLEKLVPSFGFDELRGVSDYDVGEDVWGYGAHQATAQGVGDATVDFLHSVQAKKPFFLWAFHFDAHAWRELDDEYLREAQERFGIPTQGEWSLRYRVVARTVDEQFGRLLETLRDTGRERDTAVVFLSDHGEGLGQGGFWVHSIFLWDSLVQVPLAIRIPGVASARIEVPVSLVDVAPTIAPVFGGGGAVYHGQSLTLGEESLKTRRLPILLRGGTFGGLDRVGIVDGESRRKLVIRLEAAFPELYAYEEDRVDHRNLARSEASTVHELLRTLATSPVFPRTDGDFALASEPSELAPGVP
jgi:hypothetical protein